MPIVSHPLYTFHSRYATLDLFFYRYSFCEVDNGTFTSPPGTPRGGAKGGGEGETCKRCKSHQSQIGEPHNGAMALFVISELLQGMANAPKITMTVTYIDDNTKDQSPAHFG